MLVSSLLHHYELSTLGAILTFSFSSPQSFFGRTYNNLSSISECKNNGECVINKKNRTACKACRLRKCLLVGMSKSGSRYGRRSNWFKIHCLLQEQQNKASNVQHNGHSGMPNNPPMPNDFIPSHFLANLYNNINNNNNNKEIKRVSSPSDSGASSADPDESIKFSNNNNVTKSKNLNTVSEKPVSNSSPSDGYVSPVISQKISSSVKPVSPFLPFALHHRHSLSPSMSSRTPNIPELFMLSLPQISLTAASPLPRHSGSHYNVVDDSVQNEPIDLSVKSSKRLRDDVDVVAIRSSSPASHDVAAPATKTVPLDLTLVRSG